MSTVKTNNLQVGQSATPTNNFTLYQPSSPDGTVRLGVGNAGSVTELLIVDSSGRTGLGGTPQLYQKLAIIGTYPTGNTSTEVVSVRGTIPSSSTATAAIFFSRPTLEAASFTLNELYHFTATPTTFGAGSAVTTQYGFAAGASLTAATNNYGFFGNIASGTGRWNFYAAGTAANYFAGNVQIGNTSATTTPVGAPPLQITTGANLIRFSTSFPAAFDIGRSKSGTIGTNTAVASGDTLGYINFVGADGTGYVTAARVTAEVDGTPGTNDMPGRLVFSTTADGASTPTEAMRIDSAGEVGIGTNAPGVKLHVAANNPTRGIIGQFANTASSGQTGAQIHLSQSGIADWVIGQPAGVSAIAFWRSRNTGADGSEYMRIAADGSVGIGITSPTCALDVVGGIKTSRTAVTAPAASDGNVFSGTYTPTLTNVTNVAASTSATCQYMRVGDVVTVSGTVSIDPTAASTLTVIRISLPIASAMTATTQLAGACHGNWVVGVAGAGAMVADTTNDEALLRTIPPNDANASYSFTFTYRVV